MYLKFETELEFPELAQALEPTLTEDDIDWDSENVYEWMYIDLPELEFSLNISRERGWAELDDEQLAQYEDNAAEQKRSLQPGRVYVFGWDHDNSDYVDELPDFLPSFFADRLGVEVFVFSRRINVDLADDQPVAIIAPQAHRSPTTKDMKPHDEAIVFTGSQRLPATITGTYGEVFMFHLDARYIGYSFNIGPKSAAFTAADVNELGDYDQERLLRGEPPFFKPELIALYRDSFFFDDYWGEKYEATYMPEEEKERLVKKCIEMFERNNRTPIKIFKIARISS